MAQIKTVGDLIEELEGYDREARVFLMEQPSWPFEYAIRGVCDRQEFQECDPEMDDKKLPNDVFLLEGGQLRYGSKAAFDCAW